MTDQTQDRTYETKAIALPGFGKRGEVRELATRLQKMMPGGQVLTMNEALALAQVAHAHELDPFNGECWLLKNRTTGEVYGACIGIKGMRKHAKRQANYWGVGANGGFKRITDPQEMEFYGLKDGDIAYTFMLMDDVTIEAYVKSIERLQKVGIPLDEAQKMLGGAPVTLGIGVWRPGDLTKMRPSHCAMFRAEKDALKRRFDILWNVQVPGVNVIPGGDEEFEDAEEVEAEYIGLEDEGEGNQEHAEQALERAEQALMDLGYDPAPEKVAPDPAPVPDGAPNIPAKKAPVNRRYTMTLEEANNVTGSDGKKYGDTTTEVLSHKYSALCKALNKADLTPEEVEEKSMKKTAIEIIMTQRAGFKNTH